MIHREWINETLQYYKEQEKKHNWRISSERKLFLELCVSADLIRVVKTRVNPKTKEIMHTIESNLANKYFKVTEKMKLAIASDLLNNYSFEYIAEILCAQPKQYNAYIYDTSTNEIIAKATRSTEQEAIDAAETFATRILAPHPCTTNEEGLKKPFYIEEI